MKIYIGIDKETWENVAVETSKNDVLEELWDQDVYFLSEEDFYKNYENAYIIQEHEVNLDERTKIRKVFQRKLVFYNMDIAKLEKPTKRNQSNILSAQLAMIKVKREAIQELYDEVFKEEMK